MKLDVLLIAPKSSLNVHEEVAALVSNHNCVTVLGEITPADIRQAVNRHERFDCLWFACHGGEGGIELLPGQLLTVYEIVQFVRVTRTRLVVFNSCSTEEIAQAIVSNGKTDVIYSRDAVPNALAVQLGVLLAGELAGARTFYEAFELVAPSGGSYRYYAADGVGRGVLRSYRRDDGYDRLEERLVNQIQAHNELNRVMSIRSAVNSMFIVFLLGMTVYLWWKLTEIEEYNRVAWGRIEERLTRIEYRLPLATPYWIPGQSQGGVE